MPSQSPKPLSPPPAYTEVAEPSHSSSPSARPMHATPHGSYGPTPIAQQTFLLPYYDPRSAYSVSEAASRARWRFVGAMIWALVILACAGVVMGFEAEMQLGRRDGQRNDGT